MHTRRRLLRTMATLPLLWAGISAKAIAKRIKRRLRPADPAWPKHKDWEVLNRSVGGRLSGVRSPLKTCLAAPTSAECAQMLTELHNPYYVGDEPGLTQTLGWVDAWIFAPSIYAVAAESTRDVVAAVNFARARNLRLVVKGGGHSYQGTSNAADSLLVWTRHMNSITVHDDFVPAGCAAAARKHAVSVGAGAIWMQVYDAVTTRHGRYVQGGGCTTVGVAGLIQSGGFGSFSKRYGTAAGSLLEAEIVTADGRVQLANPCTNPELFWAIKGGGGGSFGVISRLTLETHELPEHFGLVSATIQSNSDAAFRRLIENTLRFYRDHLLNPHWGEQITLKEDRVLAIHMVSQGIDRATGESIWHSFFEAVANAPEEFSFVAKPRVMDFPARSFWDPEFLKRIPGVTSSDDRAGAAAGNLFWAGDAGQCGQVLHAYDSAWLPESLLNDDSLPAFADALHAAAKQWEVSLHLNKGLAGAPTRALAAAMDTATNPAVLGAFALAIIAAEEPPAYPGIAGHEPNIAEARRDAAGIHAAMAELRKVLPDFACYVAESNFFEPQWQSAFWGENYRRLLQVKSRYDPDGLFFVHHGVGSEAWSADGFTPLA
ncbi:MAG: FAD-dependent oxidoreductase [Gammaproteobacteria bacterium]